MGPSCLGTIGKGCEAQHPIVRERALTSRCERTRGGTKTVGIPQYVMTVVNEVVPVDPAPPPVPPPVCI
jgi:hypothetical protein